MGLDFAASVACDHCGAKALIRVGVTKLRPQAEMHLRLPAGWVASTLLDSSDLYITCRSCPPPLMTVPPPPAVDPARDPTEPPPPPPGAPR